MPRPPAALDQSCPLSSHIGWPPNCGSGVLEGPHPRHRGGRLAGVARADTPGARCRSGREAIHVSIERAFGPGKGLAVWVWTSAPPESLWDALADPVRWPDWSPHILAVARPGGHRGHVVAGEKLIVRGPVSTRVTATVTRVDPGRRWDWRVGPAGRWSLIGVHEVLPAPACDPSGCRVRVSMRVVGPLAAVLDRTALLVYAPLADLAVRRLAALTARRSGPSRRPPTGGRRGPGSSTRT